MTSKQSPERTDNDKAIMMNSTKEEYIPNSAVPVAYLSSTFSVPPTPAALLPGSSHPAVTSWNDGTDVSLRTRVKAALDASKVKITLLGLFRLVGLCRINNEHAVTVVIAVLPGSLSKTAARNAVRQICLLLQDQRLHESVAVELVEGHSTRLTTHTSDCHQSKRYIAGQGMSFEDTFCTHPLVGTSIGPSGSSLSGTLGCYLKLVRSTAGTLGGTKDVNILALTNHHVLCPDIAGPITATGAKNLLIDHPSSPDVRQWVPFLQEQERLLNARMLGAKNHLFNALAQTQSDTSQAVQAESQRLNTARNVQTLFGSVLCTSGLATYDHGPNQSLRSHLDWGLVQVHASRLPTDLSTVTNPGFLGLNEANNHVLLQTPAPHVLQALEHWQSMHHDNVASRGSLVYKVGRTTGVTVGQLAACEVLVRHYKATDQAAAEHTEVTEHVIVSAGPGDFAGPGDSGAVVCDPQSNPVGLLFGGFANKPQPGREWTATAASDRDRPAGVAVYFSQPGVALCGVSLYTPFDVVLRSMRATLAGAFGDDRFELSYAA
ncbi:hypothetical protein CONLIGDRAFT_650608 [Coniochaeta ligniaria NRRL 30616]|uniref:Uncharacterized protein n=1 Tax=Coniochaeta ligniaria NRRL 30616 TaxID=1408157 RepID=A0A1J7IZT7_9PEZI|nr:hypothetical protein CONLIGDRAFT_650608 [Coniochaeta ligniaria NRRL 30616]